MIIQPPAENIKGMFTAFPENLAFSDALLWIGTAVLIAWLIALTVSGGGKRRRLVFGILLPVAGAIGAAGYIFYQSVNEHLGGYYLNGGMSEEMLLPRIETDPAAPPRDYLIYLPGSICGRRFRSDIVRSDTLAVLPAGYDGAIRRFAARLRPQDRLHLVGFSRGGGEALALAYAIRRPIASLVIADPTADVLQSLEYRLCNYRKPANVEYFKVFTVRDYDAVTDSNESIRSFLFLMVARFIDRRYVEVVNDDHGMRTTGYRIDERHLAEAEKLRRRVIADRAAALTSDASVDH